MEMTQNNLAEFPCSFNMDLGRLTTNKLLLMSQKIKIDLQIGKSPAVEINRAKNLLTLVEFQLGHKREALKICNEVVEKTENRNMVSLGNLAFIHHSMGNEFDEDECISKLNKLKDSNESNAYLEFALGEQAYSYSRMGGQQFMELALNQFRHVLKKYHIGKGKYLWQFGIGICLQRILCFPGFILTRSDKCVELIKEAVQILFEVVRIAEYNNETKYFKAIAFATLAILRTKATAIFHFVEDLEECFQSRITEEFIFDALCLGKDNYLVLEKCGKTLKLLETQQAIAHLEKARSINWQSTYTSHQLGLCHRSLIFRRKDNYARSYQVEPRQPQLRYIFRKQQHLELITSKQEQEIRYFQYKFKHSEHKRSLRVNFGKRLRPGLKHKRTFHFDKFDHNVQKAIEYFSEAEELSHSLNTSAMMDLASLQKETDDDESALRTYGRIISNSFLFQKENDNCYTIINAYKNYIEILQKILENKEGEERQRLVNKIKSKILEAIIWASSVVDNENINLIISQFQDYESFILLESNPNPDRKLLIELYHLMRDNKDVIHVIDDIIKRSDVTSLDLSTVQKALDSYLKENKFEDALAFVYFLKKNPDSSNVLPQQLYFDTMLKAISNRFHINQNESQSLFQSMLRDQMCQHAHGNSWKASPATHSNECSTLDKYLDILIICDDTEESFSDRMAKEMAFVMYCVFGLDCSINLQRSSSYGQPIHYVYLEEMKKHRVVLVLLTESDELGNADFQCLFELKPLDFIVLNCGCSNDELKKRISSYKQFDLRSLTGTVQNCEQNTTLHQQMEAIPETKEQWELLIKTFKDDLESWLALFRCFVD